MEVEFNFLFNWIKYDMQIPFEKELNFTFQMMPYKNNDNIKIITKKISEINHISKVEFKLSNPIKINFVDKTAYVYIEPTVYFYPSETILGWKLQSIPTWLEDVVQTHTLAVKNIVIGTASHYINELRNEAKEIIKNYSIKYAQLMHHNAIAILDFMEKNYDKFIVK
jgi:hypothetical protein